MGHMPYSDEDAYHHEVSDFTPEDLYELDAIINRAAIHEDDYENGRWHPGDR